MQNRVGYTLVDPRGSFVGLAPRQIPVLELTRAPVANGADRTSLRGA